MALRSACQKDRLAPSPLANTIIGQTVLALLVVFVNSKMNKVGLSERFVIFHQERTSLVNRSRNTILVTYLTVESGLPTEGEQSGQDLNFNLDFQNKGSTIIKI